MADPAATTTPAPPAPASVQVDNAQNVNVPGPPSPLTQLPYVHVIAGVTFAILITFALVTYWVISSGAQDPMLVTLKGSLIQTWNNLAVMAAGFWLASSLGGKLTASAPHHTPPPTGRNQHGP